MKRKTAVRFLCSVAIVLSLWNWSSYFIWMTFVGGWEWNCGSLIDLVRSVTVEFSYLFKVNAVAAFLCGSLPLATGLLGFIRPGSKAFFVVSVIDSFIVIISVIVIYMGIFVLYGQNHTPIIKPGIGTYVTAVILIIEIFAGIIARRQAACCLPD